MVGCTAVALFYISADCCPVVDFCLWAPSDPNSTVADREGEMVAWCTKPGRGTRLIPAGALQGVQYIKTPDYAQVVGFVNQQLINIAPDDFGGEMDPHGADLVSAISNSRFLYNNKSLLARQPDGWYCFLYRL